MHFTALRRSIAVAAAAILISSAMVVSAMAVEWQVNGKKMAKEEAVSSESPAFEGAFFSDDAAGIELECGISDSGTVGAGAAGTITGMSTGPCDVIKNGGGKCVSGSVDVKDFPWATELIEEESGEIRDRFKEKAGGSEPQFELLCNKEGGGFFDDTCSAETSARMTNVTSGVIAAIGGKTKCEDDSEKEFSGEMNGDDDISGCPNMTVAK
jgi:hypothetical protein